MLRICSTCTPTHPHAVAAFTVRRIFADLRRNRCIVDGTAAPRRRVGGESHWCVARCASHVGGGTAPVHVACGTELRFECSVLSAGCVRLLLRTALYGHGSAGCSEAMVRTIAIGVPTIATGVRTIAIGVPTIAIGVPTIAIGVRTIATGVML